jgi:hypothetical protein
MSGSEYIGVKLPEFDVMAGKHTQAADRLAALAQALHRELQGAGLDTTPAARIRELAAQVGRQAEDLRRRQILIQEMQREKVAFGFSVPEGSYLHIPDKLETARALLDGSVAANLARQAAQGDAKALERLNKYATRVNDAEFTKIFLERLGAHGVTALPAGLARSLHEAKQAGDAERLNRLSQQAKQLLGMLSEALAQATDPKHPAYAGDAFLEALQKEGRAELTIGDIPYSGYQAQSLIWAAHDGKPPFSAKFMQTVGQDAIAYEAELYAARWAASDEQGMPHLSMLNLAAVLGLGTALRPSATITEPGKTPRSSVVDDLLHAAGSSRDASQALLGHTPPGWKATILTHLLTTRLDAFQHTGQYGHLSRVLISATTGQDPASKKLAAETIKTLAGSAESVFSVTKVGDVKVLQITDRSGYDKLRHLGHPLALAMAANISELSRVFLNRASFQGVGARDMSWALALAVGDDKGFEALIGAQVEHARHAFAGVPPVGLQISNLQEYGYTEADLKRFDMNANGVVDKADVVQFFTDRTVEEAVPFRHLIEIREKVHYAIESDDEKSNEALAGMVRSAIGMFPIPGSAKVGDLATGVFGSLLTQSYDKAVNAGYDELSRHVSGMVSTRRINLDLGYKDVSSNQESVVRIVEQMLATNILSKGMLDGAVVKNEIFVEGDPPRVKPFAKMTPEEYSGFLEWARRSGGSSDILERFDGAYNDTKNVMERFER